MKIRLLASLGFGALVLTVSQVASAHVSVGLNIGVPAPVYVAPAPYYAPPPAPVAYYPAPVVAPAVIIGWHGNRYWDGHRYWGRREWNGRRHY